MPTLDEQYQALIDSSDEGGINENGLTAKQIFLAGAAAEREAVLTIIAEVLMPLPEAMMSTADWNNAQSEIERRIRQRGEPETNQAAKP